MQKGLLLPRLAKNGIFKNKQAYLPYLLTTSFAICVFFIFDCITQNKILAQVPYAAYVTMLLVIGKVLLALILIPFLFYTNGFLMKRRKKEIGLYSMLGLEKKHIGCILLLESIMTFAASYIGGIIAAIVFSKLAFLVLLNISGLPITTTFTMSPSSFLSTGIFFLGISILNLVSNWIQVGKSNPTELLSGGRTGEKEPRFLWVYTLLGLLLTGFGYYLSITATMDSMVFSNFFFAVLFVVAGTYFLFTSGSIFFLKLVKRNKRFYYNQSNFITVSGMLYRMKKSAASLSNICVFSTMIIITLLCTLSLSLGQEEAIKFFYPYDFTYVFDESKQPDYTQIDEGFKQIAKDNDITITDTLVTNYYSVDAIFDDNNHFRTKEAGPLIRNQYTIRIISLDQYNRIAQDSKTLEDHELLLYSTTSDFNYDTVLLNDSSYSIKEELTTLPIASKNEHSYSNQTFYLVANSNENAKNIANSLKNGEAFNAYMYNFNIEQNKLTQDAFSADATAFAQSIPSMFRFDDIVSGGATTRSMNGGLLFIGIFFGLIFMICLVLIMYYKQISEGMEDQVNFKIMQQVGMSDQSVRKTIKKQILIVFTLPLAGAILHTLAGLNFTIILLYALNLFQTKLILLCAGIVLLLFILFYLFSYFYTAKAYYRIVKQPLL